MMQVEYPEITHHGTPIRELALLPHQKLFVDTVAAVVSMTLTRWPVASGKTVARKALAQRLLDDDEFR